LIAGVARVVVVQHGTFLINSACHVMGRQPYSKKCSARDSWLLAIFTFGEGYHNYHHEFQYDYRNGVRPWQVDPTKWIIWLLSKLGLTRNLRRASSEKIRAAQAEASQLR
jgi:stearoyl-CoA desaturase (Delta-9 desaturase)